MLESMNKKTLVIIGSSIIGLIVFLLIVVWLISIIKPHYYTYEEFETKVSEAAKSYYKNNPTALPSTDGEYNMSYNTLVEGEYVKPLNEMLKDGDNCTVQILVTKYSDNYSYIPYLNCPGSYETKELYKVISENNPVVEKGSGLYSDGNGGYYFRGEITNNYVQLGTYGETKKDQSRYLWQILGIESDGSVKIRSTVGTTKRYAWDDRYNEEIKEAKGINNFEVSRLKEFLDNYIDNNQTLITAPRMMKLSKHSVCTGKINEVDTNVCSSKVDNVYVSTITAQDYVNASLDSNCSISNSISCQNYNFLNKKSWTITAYKDNTYGAYYIDDTEGLQYGQAYLTRATLPVISLRSDTIYVSGTGTEAAPFMIK